MPIRYKTRLLSAITITALAAVSASAQNSGGVFPPMVNEGHQSAQYRIAINPDSEGVNQRLHYQQAINGDLMWRVIGAVRKPGGGDVDFDFVQAELFWELSDDDDVHKSGLRFDARLRDDDRSNILGVNWMNQFNFNDGWSARALALSSVQIGDNAADGIGLQSRFQINKKLVSGPSIGVELYNNYGNSEDIGSFDEQSHTVGPYVNWPVTQDWSIFAGPLFGITEAAPDNEFRLWVTKPL